eukprot:3031645-Pleurochrysis_carterae.AAC.1
MVVVGAYAIEQVLPLLEKWLASVPAPAANTARMPKELKPLHVQFPSGVVSCCAHHHHGELARRGEGGVE